MLEHDNDLFCDVIKHVFVIGYMGMLLTDSHCRQHKNEKNLHADVSVVLSNITQLQHGISENPKM